MPEITDAELAELRAAKETSAKLSKEIEELRKTPTPTEPAKPAESEEDLRTKAQKEKELNDAKGADAKRIERAVSFNFTIDEFAKVNKDLLPEDIEGILQQAKKENYDSVAERANALKSSVVLSFFAVQANYDVLTPAQKAQVDSFLKLTKTGREQRADEIYDNVFEPAFETLKRVKKASEVARAQAGFSTPSNAEAAYKEKMIQVAAKAHLRKGV